MRLFFCFWVMLFLSCSRENSPTVEEKIRAIDTEISLLQEDLKRYRQEAREEEQTAQPYLLSDWHTFSLKVEKSEENYRMIEKTRVRLQELKKQKGILESQRHK